MKKRSKKAKRQAVEKQRLRDEADAKRQRSEEPGVCPLLVRTPSSFLDLCYVDAAAGDVLSGEEPMGDNLADAASALPLGELSRVVQACRVLFCICFSTLTSPSVYLYPLSLLA